MQFGLSLPVCQKMYSKLKKECVFRECTEVLVCGSRVFFPFDGKMFFNSFYNFSLFSNYEFNFQKSAEHMASVTDTHYFT